MQHHNHHQGIHGLDSVNVSLMRSEDGTEWKTQPLVITPRWDTSLDFLKEFLTYNRTWMDDMILKYGAVLCRGFDIKSAPQFEEAVSSYQPNLNHIYQGTSPRNPVDGCEKVFSAAEVPTYYPIAQHLEMSFLPSPPRQLYFGCLKESASAGGATALCDFKKVYQEIPLELRQKLLEKKLLYTRTQRKVGAKYTHDVSDMKGWPEIFKTSNKQKVEEICEKAGDTVKWINGGDTFQSQRMAEAFQLHPETKEPVWFNHSQVFHWTTFPAELWHAFIRTKDVRYLFHCLWVAAVCLIRYVLLGYKMSLDCSFGDGTPISMKEMSQIRHAVHKHIIYNRWHRGDILFIDNFGTSHGRQPTYDGGRKIVVSWSQSFTKQDLLTTDKAMAESKMNMNPQQEASMVETIDNTQALTVHQMKKFEEEVESDAHCGCTGNPQERTLTEEDRLELRGLSNNNKTCSMAVTPNAKNTSSTSHSRSYSALADESFWQATAEVHIKNKDI